MKKRANDSALVDLDRLLDGTLSKRFGVEWEKVLDNCYDMRAAATKPRTITLKISVIPNIGRDACDIKADITTHLQPAEALKQMTYMRPMRRRHGSDAGLYLAGAGADRHGRQGDPSPERH